MARTPVLLVVSIQTSVHRWFCAGVSLQGNLAPLIRSDKGNLDPYVGQAIDEQVSFLRHRLSGVLQRGCDRLWGREEKPCQIVFVADQRFVDSDEELTQRVADHFVDWMTSPPVVFLLCDGTNAPDRLAGDWVDDAEQAMQIAMTPLFDARERLDEWEMIPAPPRQ